MTTTTTTWRELAAELDAADPLAGVRDEFLLDSAPGVTAYLDGNSLGRPLRATATRMTAFIEREWGGRLIRGWTEGWMDWPQQLGDQLGRAVLGAAPGQTVVADSTTVMLYKLARAAVDAAADGRDEIVCDTDNFPTDRYVVEGIAAERGCRVRWIETDPDAGITLDQVRAAVGPRTALALFSHVAYRSAHLADAPGITRAVHDAGGLVLFDLSHSAGSVELDLDGWGVDLAVGCTYKYLCGGPGAPAFGYLAARHHGVLRQPVQGWMGHADPFAMGPGHTPAAGARALLSGTPPIVAMVPVRCGLDLVERVGMAAIRAKSVLLTRFALDLADDLLAGAGVTVASPRADAERGGHVTLRRPDFRAVNDRLWEAGVIPDFRAPDGIRLGLAPLSTSFAEVLEGVQVLAREAGR
ncbi:kynureninase [Pseudonocardia humida]|uniref:Kynureninase n=1 Tax=Pseudonocardia humida TaxID=2800819 RepID=A0ABT1A3R9_9PSEU|nr:aminotransferase class V-fold PLP-dependent enzyme [Pseudonocardia humida]MCO1657655.1 aminotransferase class V-fold PLP-dependent enzyme [Pseudonocardia humida]